LRILLERELLLPLSSTSLGLANLLFLTLSLLEVEKRETIVRPIVENVYELIILAIEEPEAHLHPHVQRVLFRDFLKRSPLILTTHSPHIASVAPIDSILMFRQQSANQSSTINSTAVLAQVLDKNELSDLSRYLDITRAEILFARGVIFVEGDTEEYTIPAFARLLGINLDKFGITVCNIGGTNFKPYVKFLGIDGLNIPFIILTDGDKYANLKSQAIPYARNENLITDREVQKLRSLSSIELRAELERREIPYYDGLKRCIALIDEMQVDDDYQEKISELYKSRQWQDVVNELHGVGIFINEWSFESSILQSGYAEIVLNVLEECGVGPRVLEQLKQEKSIVHANDELIEYWIKQIENLGKGRVGQRLSTKLFALEHEGNIEASVPENIRLGLSHLLGLLNFEDSKIDGDSEAHLQQTDDGHEDPLPF
jgi:putative ATP-dependent endonuclease of the OLD family